MTAEYAMVSYESSWLTHALGAHMATVLEHNHVERARASTAGTGLVTYACNT